MSLNIFWVHWSHKFSWNEKGVIHDWLWEQSNTWLCNSKELIQNTRNVMTVFFFHESWVVYSKKNWCFYIHVTFINSTGVNNPRIFFYPPGPRSHHEWEIGRMVIYSANPRLQLTVSKWTFDHIIHLKIEMHFFYVRII